MWLEPVRRKIQAKQLDSLAERLDAAGLIKEFYIILRKSKPIVTAIYQNEFLSIIRILTEETWKELKQNNSNQPDELVKPQNLSLDKTSEKSSQLISKHKKQLSMPSIDLPSPSSSTKKYIFTTTPLSHSRTESFYSTPKYKNPVSQEVAYMSTFSFPKGCATFTRTKRKTTNPIPDLPGPGSYFCDPRSLQSSNTSQRTSILSSKSTKHLSFSFLKL